MEHLEISQVQVYTGKGKGKTTAALGQGIRSFGAGLKVIMVSFMKNPDSSEFKALTEYASGIRVIHANQERRGFYWQLSNQEKTKTGKDCLAAYDMLKELVSQQACDVLILDEIMAVLEYKIIPLEEILQLMQQCKESHIELILTGRNAPIAILEAADLVTEMKEIKHPLTQGIKARQGIEY